MKAGSAILLAAVGLFVADIYNRSRPIPVYYVRSLPGGYNALTVPPVGIFIVDAQRGNNNLVLHEIVHWLQYLERGTIPFYLQYLFEYWQYGYDCMPMEVQARYLESHQVQQDYTAAVRDGRSVTVYNPQFRSNG